MEKLEPINPTNTLKNDAKAFRDLIKRNPNGEKEKCFYDVFKDKIKQKQEKEDDEREK